VTIRDKVGQAGSYARDKASSAREALSGAREKASVARTSGADKIDESPVIALVGGLALGAIAAAFLPRTEKEKQLLGPVGSKVTSRARDAVQAAREAGQNKLGELGINKEAIGGAVKNLASSAADAAKQAATSAAGAAKQSASSGDAGSTGDGTGGTGPSGSTGLGGSSSGLAGSTETSTSTAVI